MTEQFATINGVRATSARVFVPPSGPWYADLDVDGDGAISGAAVVKIGDLELRGTVDPTFTGSFQLSSSVRVVAGAGGWAKDTTAKGFHSDAGVKRSTVVSDIARSVGELLVYQSGDGSLGVDFVRLVEPASRALELAIGSASWWVGYDGVTVVGTRPTVEFATQPELLSFDPHSKVATLAPDSLAALVVGGVLRGRLDSPLVIRELRINLEAGKLRVEAWCGYAFDVESRLLRAIRTIARETFANYACLSPRRYRVVRLSVDRLELQAIKVVAGLPDILPISVWPGMAGLSADVAIGAVVLVQFIDGDPAMPIVTHFSPKDGAGFLPAKAALDATDEVRIGEHASSVVLASGDADPLSSPTGRVVRYGDSITFLAPGPGAIAPAAPIKLSKVSA